MVSGAAALFGNAGVALQTAVSVGGATTLTLSDGTRITFLGVASATTRQGHLV